MGSTKGISFMGCRRPSTIRTRIKTCRAFPHILIHTVADHLPLEQGLRQSLTQRMERQSRVADHLPLEQGHSRNTEGQKYRSFEDTACLPL